MLKKYILSGLILGLGFCPSFYSFCQKEEESTLIAREGKQVRRDTVAIEAYAIHNILRVNVEARMYSERPKISKVLLVGPKIGRMTYYRKEEIPINLEEKTPYLISKKGGLFSSRDNTEEKDPKGTLTHELFEFKVPGKIVSGKKYELWVYIEGKNSAASSRPQRFSFNLPNFTDYFK
ncbi:MAG: hypothetical protein GF375_06130 [Candidatus Omnitrophica bacterium]|nr:hypothetical protein [Candidatus Omnitrophota bacterium]MBD3269553.1 hypothetical protein [Candidatus Omnitrophota bacterium]